MESIDKKNEGRPSKLVYWVVGGIIFSSLFVLGPINDPINLWDGSYSHQTESINPWVILHWYHLLAVASYILLLATSQTSVLKMNKKLKSRMERFYFFCLLYR